MRRLIGAVVLVVLVAAVVRGQDETYTIKIKPRPDEGKSAKNVNKSTAVNKVKVTDEDNNVLKDETKKESKEEVYTEKTLKVEKGKVIKFQRAYDRARETKGKKDTVHPYEGRTVVFERDGDKFNASVQGKPDLDDEVLEKLGKDATRSQKSKQEAILPKKAVKVGETWKITGKDVSALFADPTIDSDKAKGIGKLLKVYKKDGKQWGSLEFKIQMEQRPKDAPAAIKIDLTGVLDTPIDGSSTAGKMTFKAKGGLKFSIEQNGKKYNVESAGDETATQEQTEVK
jgi:hypothetical protein